MEWSIRALVFRALVLPKRFRQSGRVRAAVGCWFAAAVFGPMAAGQTAAPAKAEEILARECMSCHGPTAMGGLDLRTREGLLRGGGRGPAVVAGDPEASLLVQAVQRKGSLQMPPGRRALPEEEVRALAAWVKGGATYPQPGGAGQPAGEAVGSAAVRSTWWSFQKLRRPAVPVVGRQPGRAGGGAADPATSPIDAFLLAKMQSLGLRPGAKADKRTLLRRATFDLHGLPPTPEEMKAFLADSAPNAFAKVVDRLLASPRYGERWGRHWLDVVRYADTGGFETDIYFPNAWRYRDYVIKSFNDDKPFHRFVQEQIAGDELFPGDLDLEGGFQIPAQKLQLLEARIATGLYTIGPVYHEAALFGGQIRYEWLTDAVDTTGEAFFGLTLGCARCHNHKFDPLTQKDYHAMMAIFAGSEEREIPVVSQFNTFGFKSGYPNWLRVEELKGAIQRIDRAARQRVVDRLRQRFSGAELAAYDTPVERRRPAERELAAKVEAAFTEAGLQENAEGKEADIPLTPEESSRREALVVELGRAALKANPVAQTATVLGHAAVTPAVHLTHRGDWRSQGEVVAPALPAVLASGAPPAEPVFVETAQTKLARRSALAKWLTQPDHPLTARVMANRVWHWHFGRGIVATPNDFGRQGEEPTHPELLDWLASELVENNGSLKHLHRLILLSEAYQRSSQHDEANARIDANNRYLWRMNRLRLDAETLRDAVLATSGALHHKMGGRPVVPKLSPEEYSVMWARNQWPESLDPTEQNRRSVYLYVKRTFPLPMLSTFDAPDSSLSCSRRESTTVAPQALTLMNGEFMVSQAAQLAARAQEATGAVRPAAKGRLEGAASRPEGAAGRPEGAGANGAAIEWMWARAVGRAPTEAERRQALQLLQSTPKLELVALALLNTNEFLYVD